MSRYVTKKHGLVIGSDNVFFFQDHEDVLHQFPAIVSVSNYYFDMYTTLHVGLKTPAEQLIFHYESTISYEPKVIGGTEYTLENRITRAIVKPFFVNWLNENTPGWAKPERDLHEDQCIFFAKRGHALEFTKKVEQLLAGMKIGLV